MDFLVREVRAVTAGPLRIIRLGSCAGLRADLPVGTVAVASEGSLFISQNPDAWAGTVPTKPDGPASSSSAAAFGQHEAASRQPYVFHGVAEADEKLSSALLRELKRSLGEEAVVGCLNASADSFYASQGERRGLALYSLAGPITCVVAATLLDLGCRLYGHGEFASAIHNFYFVYIRCSLHTCGTSGYDSKLETGCIKERVDLLVGEGNPTRVLIGCLLMFPLYRSPGLKL